MENNVEGKEDEKKKLLLKVSIYFFLFKRKITQTYFYLDKKFEEVFLKKILY